MRIISRNGEVVAVVFDGMFEEGTKPLTDEKWALQIVSLKHPKGKKLVSHTHKPTQRTTEYLMEFLLIMSGVVNVYVYHGLEMIEKIQLTSRKGILMVKGGIGIEIIEDAEMMEFKNGPFIEDKVIIE
ncbi:hypothetical protein A3D55_00370 [Candidatus Jorgensenbacteria bacterium RIFCSPHIGHO2_02_FULL_45_20]|uniref:Uncharacterized protein n=1 Tax=Candidatus Jorgensenbacteria bacterium RIFCSPHIGHO2_02_FULL_45_20 TaxID=1798470 RepID=A0A1F6BN69_9BACT|nr:MAG: hypothetical protein A3D55_00370 [Candidatus Jorgensenbacteria bacterium RIFCSPHIGHO2_02_FULL_45_20]